MYLQQCINYLPMHSDSHFYTEPMLSPGPSPSESGVSTAGTRTQGGETDYRKNMQG
jgi:hypothetical protein